MRNKKKNEKVAYHTLHFICSLTRALRPKEKMSVSDWADKHMVLPGGSNKAGKFRSDSVPYQKEIMNAITDPAVTEVTVMSSAQIGKTTIVLCGIAYYIEHEPSTQLLVLPTLSLGEKFSKTRLAPMIRDIPVLRDKIAPAKSKDSDNTILFKQYAGGYIVVSGANSAASLSSMPIRVVWMDEVDRFPASAGGEGDPVTLAQKRATTFWNKKYIKTSTPTTENGRINKEYLKGTQEEWCVQCPCCGMYQPYSFKRMDFNIVGMKCEYCEEVIEEKYWKESEHMWIAARPERKNKRSFHLNAMASPWVDWSDIIDEFQSAMDEFKTYHDTEKLQAFINTTLGETWKEDEVAEESTTEDKLLERAEHYKAEIPEGVLLLTAAVDVQDNRFEVEVKGWARDYESWGIHKTEIYGNLETSQVWDELEEYLETTFRFEDGRELNIAAFGIDTGGHHTNRVYKWIKAMKKKGKKAYGIKGYAGKPDIPLLYKRSKVEIKEKSRDGKRDIVVDSTTIWILGVDAGKENITNWLTIEEKGEGYCHFPNNVGKGYDREYYKGLLSEKKIKKKVRGVIKDVWVKKSGARNEPLDLFNYNLAVCELLRPVWSDLELKISKGINYTKTVKKVRKQRKSTRGLSI